MTGCMHYFDGKPAYFEIFAIRSDMNGKICLSSRAINNSSVRGFAEVNMAADKIRMKMCLEDILDLCFSLIGQLEVNVDIPQRINDCCLSFAFNIIGCLTETAC